MMTNPGQNYTGEAIPADSLPCPEPLRALLDLSSDLFFCLDTGGRFLQLNAAATAILGYDSEELTGTPFFDLFAAEDQPSLRPLLDNLCAGTAVHDLPTRCRQKDGRLQPVLLSARRDAGQGIILGLLKATGSPPHPEQPPVVHARQIYQAYKLAQIGWWEWNIDEDRIYASEELLDIYGLPRSTVLDQDTYLSLVHPDDREQVAADLSVLCLVTTSQYDHRLVTPAGEAIHVIHYVQRVTDARGQTCRIHGTTKNISQRKSGENALRQSQQKLEDIVESLGDGFLTLDRNWNITYWNRKAERVTGMKRADVEGRNFWDLYPRARDLKFYDELHRALTQNRRVQFEEYAPSFDAWMEVNAYPSPDGLLLHIKNITERKHHEEERKLWNLQLEKANENLQHVLESMSDGFFILNRDWVITFANERVAAMINVEKEDMVGRNLWEWLPLSVHTKFYTGYHKAFAENTFVSVEDFLPHFDKWFEANAYPTNGELAVFIKDIDERKRREQELRVSNERFRFVSKATSDIIWDWNVETGAIYINQSFTKVFGYEVAEGMLPSRVWKDNLHPADKDRVVASQQQALQNPTVTMWEDNYRFRKKCGETAYVADRAVIIRNEEGQALRMIGAVQDVTERKKQERRLEFIARATSEVIWERNLQSEEVEINSEKLRHMFGYQAPDNRVSLAEWFGQIHPDDIQVVKDNLNYALQQDLDFFLNEYRFKKQEGNWAYVRNRIHIIRNAEGKPEALIGAIEDITSERLSEKALVESEKSYRQLFNNAPLPKIIYDQDTLRILDVNSATVEHYGYSREELLAMTILDIRPGEEHPKLYQALTRWDGNYSKSAGGFVHRKKDGTLMQVEVSLTTVDYKGRKASLATINDVTEKLRLQEQLLEQKVSQQKRITRATIEAQERERGEIGKELHDNVNQMLTTAKLYVENITFFPEQGAQFVEKSVGLLQRSINEIRRLSSALAAPTLRDVGFRDTVMELTHSYKELDLFEVVCSFHFEEESIDRDVKLTIYRILQEAFNNTVKYAGASLVLVDIRSVGEALVITYRDNGTGFDPTQVKRGAGLNNMDNRAGAHGGTVQVKAAPGQGCRLDITIPFTARQPNDL